MRKYMLVFLLTPSLLLASSRLWDAKEEANIVRKDYTGKEVTIAVIGTRITDDGTNFQNRIIHTELIADTERSDHETHVASIIASNGVHYGIAPDSKIISVVIYGDPSTENILKALNWIADNKENFSIDIINFSSAFRETPYETTKKPGMLSLTLERLKKLGILIICSSGNKPIDSMAYPAYDPSVVSVAGYDKGNTISSFSYSSIFAPGNILAASHEAPWSAIRRDGSSMAAPVVTGACARYIEAYRKNYGTTPSPDKVQNIIFATARSEFLNDGKLLRRLLDADKMLAEFPTSNYGELTVHTSRSRTKIRRASIMLKARYEGELTLPFTLESGHFRYRVTSWEQKKPVKLRKTKRTIRLKIRWPEAFVWKNLIGQSVKIILDKEVRTSRKDDRHNTSRKEDDRCKQPKKYRRQ